MKSPANPHAAGGPGEEHGILWRLVRAFVTGPLSPLLLFVAAAAGVVAMVATPREEEPQIVVPMADVMVSFPGASAEEVEKLVATPLERLLWQVDGVEHVYSISRRDGAVVTVRFFVGEDRERALVRLSSRIEAHRDEVPPGVSGWVVRPVEIDDVPIVSLALWSRTADEGALRRVAEEVLARLERVEGISRSALIGGQPREVRVELDPAALAARGLTPRAIVERIGASDVSRVAGRFSRVDREELVLAGPFLEHGEDAGALVVGVHDGAPVLLSEVARVVDGPAEPVTVMRITFGPSTRRGNVRAGESFPAVMLALSKQKGTNAVHVAERILEEADVLRREVLPSDVELDVTRNFGQTADDKVDELFVHLLLAIVTVVALVAYALGWREGLIVAAAVPVTFALTLLVNQLTGYTINRVTLFALVLVLGLVCDDPIVDVENIHRHFARRERKPLDAVLFAVNEVRPPVIVATLAVILSFVPLFFITGMMGPYMRPMALNVPVAMFMSLVVAFTITPWMSYWLLKPREEIGGPEAHGAHGAHAGHAEGSGRIEAAYRRLLGALLDRAGPKRALALAIGVLAVLAAALALTGAVPLKMLPYDDKSEFLVVLDLPEGATLEATDRAVRDLEERLVQVPEVVDVESHVGVAGPIDFNGLVRRYNLRRGAELADLRVNLLPKHERQRKSHDLVLALHDDLARIADRHGARLKLVELPPGPPVLSTLVAEVAGPPDASHAELVLAARDVAQRLAGERGVVDVDVMAEDPRRGPEFRVDKQKAALHGVPTAEIVRVLELALSGETAATVHQAGERRPLPVRVTLDRAARSGAAELGRLQIAGAPVAPAAPGAAGVGDDGGAPLVALAELGEFVEAEVDQPIYHKDLERTVFVLGEVAGRPPVEAVLSMQSSLEERPLPAGITARWGGEGEWQITLDVFRDLGLAFLGALAGIYVLLVVQTHSFGLPLLVMLAIPLGAIAIFPGFYVLNLIVGREVGGYASPVWFTATGMIGMIALAGIVVRNSIILIDFVRARLDEGADAREAVLDSGAKRLRPIALTALAAMLGAWPITLDPIFSGLAWSLIFGVLASTVFTLLVIPVVHLAVLRRAELRPLERGAS